MGFTSVVFVFIFFPACIAGYYLSLCMERKIACFKRIRISDWILVLVSIAFYACSGVSDLLIFFFYIPITYFMGSWIKRNRIRGKHPCLLFVAGILIFVAVLYYFKYYNFTAQVINELTGSSFFPKRSGWTLFGVSFITFTAISYFADIYRGDAEPGAFLDTALYLSFFPKVMSGPIVLWKDFQKNLPARIFNESRFVYGINLFIIGCAKKVILADSFGGIVSSIQEQVGSGIDIPTAWGCTVLYFLQIYYDFSGYSDTAIGLAAMFGFDFQKNFNYPYISTSISEFWRRWHISLGRWFREYIYFPLGGSRRGKGITLRNLMIVFLITGIWHGAGIGYLLWGVMHGLCTVIERCIKDKKIYKMFPSQLKWLIVMLIVMLGWQVFRIPDFSDNLYFWKLLFGGVKVGTVNFTFEYYFTPKVIFLATVGLAGSTVLSGPRLRGKWENWTDKKVGYTTQEFLLFLLFALTIMFMVNSTYSPFIYFQY